MATGPSEEKRAKQHRQAGCQRELQRRVDVRRRNERLDQARRDQDGNRTEQETGGVRAGS